MSPTHLPNKLPILQAEGGQINSQAALNCVQTEFDLHFKVNASYLKSAQMYKRKHK